MGLVQNVLALLRGAPLMADAAERFREMTGLASEMVLTASAQHWSGRLDEAGAAQLQAQDGQLDELQARIRRYTVEHLSSPGPTDAPYCLLLMSLVKDVERVGDYAKNLVRIPELVGVPPGPLPEDAVTGRLRDLGREVEELARAAPQVYEAADVEHARTAVERGRARSHAYDAMIREVAQAGYDGVTTTRLILAIRFYKRIQGHLLKLLASMLTPLDRLDQYEEPGPEHE